MHAIQSILRMIYKQFAYGTTAAVLLAIIALELLRPVRAMTLAQRWHYVAFRFVSMPIYGYISWNTVSALIGGIPKAPVIWQAIYHDWHLNWILPTLPLEGLFQVLPFPRFCFYLIALFVGDLLYYLYHRAMHASPLLWPIHELHHSVKDVNVIATSYVHFLEGLPVMWCFLAPILWLGASAGGLPGSSGRIEDLLTYVITTKVLFLLSHANWRISWGPLSRVIIGPQVHWIHHSIEEKHRDRNFASIFPFWDILFGTYHHPASDEWPATGVVGVERPRTQILAFLHPFTVWVARARARLARVPIA